MCILKGTIITVVCFVAVSAFARASFISSPGALNANDSLSWSQLGAAGAVIPQIVQATSVSGMQVTVVTAGTGGSTVAQVCPAPGCNFAPAPSFGAGDFLLWTEGPDGVGTGPLSFTFSHPVLGAGLYLQPTVPGSFTAYIETLVNHTASFGYVSSNHNGDPVFIGVADTTADISTVSFGVQVCTSSTEGVCSPNDFAVSTLAIAAAPEPSAFVPLLLLGAVVVCWRRFTLRQWSRAVGITAILLTASLTRAQDPIPYDSSQEQLLDGTAAAQRLAQPNTDSTAAQALAAALPQPGLPIWRYSVSSPVNGYFYGGYMIGTSPFSRGGRTTTIPTILIPVVLTFQNTTTGFQATFDPSSAPDAGCTAGQTAMDLVVNSPLFQAQPWTVNGVDVGVTQYVDAFERASFWQYVQNTGDSYHVLLAPTIGDPLVFTLSYSAPTTAAEVRTGLTGSCTNPTGTGSVNGATYEGIVDIGTLHAAMANHIATHGITPDQFPVFILYNVIMSEPNSTGFYGGYHFSAAPYPGVLTSPGQTFAVANFRTIGTGSTDTSVLSHEIAEWMDDPGGYNRTPAWGHTGQVSGCQSNLEVGDPLTGTNLPPVLGANGFLYHFQEMAFFSWFFRTPSIGAGGLFSNNGTFDTDAGGACVP